MAVSHYQFVFATFLLSCLSVALLVASLATEKWLNGEAKTEGRTDLINYGLFQGSFSLSIIGSRNNPIYMSCVFGENVCAYSCEDTSEERKKEINTLLEGNLPETVCHAGTSGLQQPTDLTWFNSGIYLTVLILLGLSILFGVFSALLGVYNTSRIAIEPILGIFGLYIWNGLSLGCGLLVLILWGTHFEMNVKDNLTFTYMMIGISNYEFSVEVGYSYWFVFGSMICHIISEALLVWRWWLIRSAPPPPTIAVDSNTDNTIFLY